MTQPTATLAVTLEQVLEWNPCPVYSKERLAVLANGRESIDARGILELPIPFRDKIWAIDRWPFLDARQSVYLSALVIESSLYPLLGGKERKMIQACRDEYEGRIYRAAYWDFYRDHFRDHANAVRRKVSAILDNQKEVPPRLHATMILHSVVSSMGINVLSGTCWDCRQCRDKHWKPGTDCEAEIQNPIRRFFGVKEIE